MSGNRNYGYLDLVRGTAALAVLVGHVRALVFVDWRDACAGPVWGSFYVLSGLGHEAVIVFFVLSGFLIVGSTVPALQAGSWSLRRYASRRLGRLWTVLLPALALGGACDVLGGRLFPDGLAYRGLLPAIFPSPVSANLSWSILAGNALFTQTILIPCLGSNAPLWSLANEFWYYATFPLAFIAAVPGASSVRRLLCGIGAVLALLFVGPGIALRFPIWLLGGAAWLWHRRDVEHGRGRWARPAALLALAMFLVALGVSRARMLPPLASDYVLGAAVTTLIAMLASSSDPGGVVGAAGKALAERSYSLYALHLPLAVAVSAVLVPSRLRPSAGAFLIVAGILTIVAIYVEAIWLVTERHSRRVSMALEKVLSLGAGGAGQGGPRLSERSGGIP